MPSFVTVTSGATAQAQDVNQLILAMNGTAGSGVPISLTAVNDSVNFALAVKNADPTNSRALQVLRANNNVLIQADANGVIVSPDGGATTGKVATQSLAETWANKTLTSPHMTGPVVDSGGLTVTVPPVIIGSGNVATVGSMRFPNNVAIAWRSPANTTDQAFYVNGSSQFVFGDAGAGVATTTTATAGAQALPANPAGFLSVVVNGTTQKIPYYNV